MSELLKGKTGIIFGALDEQSIAWRTALAAHSAGASLLLTNAPVALRLGTVQKLAEQLNAPLIAADVTLTEDLEKLLDEAVKHFGRPVDFVLHSVGMSPNVRKNKPYTDLNYDWFMKSLDISALSLHRLLQTAMKKDAIAQGGSVVALTYIAAQRAFPGYGDMAESKAMLESIVRSMGFYYGKQKGVRINSVSQSPTRTTAGSGIQGFNAFYEFADKISPLGNASADACADFCVALFSDLSRMVTMQNLYHDGGFSTTGVSGELMELIEAKLIKPEDQ
jgi:enoyl-[acyl-carrier protein] reductase I